jgi:hypothetical protein
MLGRMVVIAIAAIHTEFILGRVRLHTHRQQRLLRGNNMTRTFVEYPPLSELLDDSFTPDYVVESCELTDSEIQDFRYMFLDFCAYRVHDSN